MTVQQRWHAFDNLRGLIMWLGIVLHCLMFYTMGPSPFPWKDPETTLFADAILLFIHMFRMPLFFMLAGYFTALLLDRRGAAEMLRNRFKRLFIPLIIFWPLVMVSMMLTAVVFTHLMVTGTLGFDPSLMPADQSDDPLLRTVHLWFLYYLILYVILLVPLRFAFSLLSQGFQTRLSALMGWCLSSVFGLFVLTLPLYLVGLHYDAGMIVPDGSFIPNVYELLHNGVHFLAGWWLFIYRQQVMPVLVRRYGCYLTVAVMLYCVVMVSFGAWEGKLLSTQALIQLVAVLFNLGGWLLSFALLGLFYDKFNHANGFFRYLADSSYWVYLVHLSVVCVMSALLYLLPVSALLKIVINIAVTSLVCLISYQYWVRYTWLGRLLNGRRYDEKVLTAERELSGDVDLEKRAL